MSRSTPTTPSGATPRGLSRWEGEGGCLGPPRHDTRPQPPLELEEAAALLGAAVLSQWDVLGVSARRRLFKAAVASRPAGDAAALVEALARRLHEVHHAPAGDPPPSVS